MATYYSNPQRKVKGSGHPMKGLALMKEIFEGLAAMVQFGASVAF